MKTAPEEVPEHEARHDRLRQRRSDRLDPGRRRACCSSTRTSKGIISPTTVGIAAAAAVLDTPQYRGKVKLTGLGTPNSLRKYVKDGTIDEFYLWNPANLGYLAGVRRGEPRLEVDHRRDGPDASRPASSASSRSAPSRRSCSDCRSPSTRRPSTARAVTSRHRSGGAGTRAGAPSLLPMAPAGKRTLVRPRRVPPRGVVARRREPRGGVPAQHRRRATPRVRLHVLLRGSRSARAGRDRARRAPDAARAARRPGRASAASSCRAACRTPTRWRATSRSCSSTRGSTPRPGAYTLFTTIAYGE